MSLSQCVYDEVIDFILKGKTLEEVMAFKSSPEISQRIQELISLEKNNKITPDEKSEMDHYMLIEHIVIMTKARAHQVLT